MSNLGTCHSKLLDMEYYPAPGRNHLFVPGPTNVPESVTRAMVRGNEDHRSPAFPKLSRSVIQDVKRIFGSTLGTAFIFPATGAVFNLHSIEHKIYQCSSSSSFPHHLIDK